MALYRVLREIRREVTGNPTVGNRPKVNDSLSSGAGRCSPALRGETWRLIAETNPAIQRGLGAGLGRVRRAMGVAVGGGL